MKLAGLLALGLTAVPLPQEGAGGRYEDLVTLFGEWREFQKPRIVDGVPDYTAAAMAAQRARLPEFQQRLKAIDPKAWPVARQVDWNLARAEMNGLEFDHRVLRPWARHPGFYVMVVPEQSDTPAKEGPAFAGALETWRYTFPLPAAAVDPFRVKLRAIPRVLEQARTNLVEDARDLWIVGIRRHKEQATLLSDLAKRLGPDHPDLAKDAESARQAEDAFRAWLESKLPEKRGPSGVGIESYDWYLKNVHLVPLTWQDEVTLHQRELGRSLAYLALEAQRNRALPVLEPIATAEEWQRRLPEEVAAYVRFLGEKQIVTVKDYMEPALRARIGAFAPPAERDFFAQVEYRDGERSHLCATILHTPIHDTLTRAWFVQCIRLPLPKWLVRSFVGRKVDQVLRQDRDALRVQTDSIRRFGGERYASTELDLMGPEILRMLKQAERGLAVDEDAPERRVRFRA
jgi:hypothetical protein